MRRVIAVVLVSEGKVVQTKRFKVTNIVGDMKTAVKFFAAWDVDEIVIVDISKEPWEGMLDAVSKAARDIFIPMTVGGHITRHEHIRDLQMVGADKILIRRGALDRPKFLRELSERHGRQLIMASAHDLIEAVNLERWGAGEILLNSPERDGTKEGFDLEMIRDVSRAVSIPVIALGGAGNPEHFIEAVEAGADAVAAGNIFHYVEHAPVLTKKAMRARGIEVRDAIL